MTIIPSMPPGKLLFEVFGSSGTDFTIFGVSAELLVSGLINGLIWSAVIVLVYSYWRGPAKSNVNLPIWVPGYTTSHSSTEKPQVKKRKDLSSPQIIQQPQNIESIHGIGYVYGRKLRTIGISTVDELLEKGSTISGRIYLANRLEVTEATVLNWLRQAEIHK
ncbi:MAG: DUF4332 domain-containing protein [Candidatus Bathyarchaeota archaeon]|nr:DUF4332 domain-containing protein [Candidatus Bathyarchaeum tardum]WNZ28882.1 MAG: DUF4332 domain-containing protein [Candidatus Bathyarchaeota archaeon]